MKKTSAGLLVYRIKDNRLEVLIAHMGGPFHAKKDAGAWSIPKGEYTDEIPIDAAKREFDEELGQPAPDGEFLELGTIEQKNNKTVIAWAIQADLDVSNTHSNTVKIEWPPKSGNIQEFPEIDKVQYFTLPVAAKKLLAAQVEFLERLSKLLELPFGDELEAKGIPQQASLF